MKVLIVAKLNSGNTYIDSLSKGVKKLLKDVTISEDKFWDNNTNYDLIHVHWIENLFGWNIENITEDDYVKLKFRLNILKNSKTKVIITYHNEYPHNLHNNILIKKIYHLFFKHVNGMIHLGNYSLNYFKKRHNALSENMSHVVINHGNYLNLKNDISKQRAREILKIPKEKFVFLSFGGCRKIEERNLMLNAFQSSNIKEKLLLSKWSLQGKSRFAVTEKLKRKWLNLNKQYRLFDLFVAEKDIQIYLNACDVMVIPRTESLNSGLVFLGFSFGKILVGPNIGNITEVIQDNNNILFNPNQKESLRTAMEKAYQLKDTGIQYNNLKYVRDKCSWDVISQSHFEFYKNTTIENS